MRERAKVISGVTPAARAEASHASTSAICQSYFMVSHATERRASLSFRPVKRGSAKKSVFWSAMPILAWSLPETGLSLAGFRDAASAGAAAARAVTSSARRMKGNERMVR